jgi:hypothetical protein
MQTSMINVKHFYMSTYLKVKIMLKLSTMQYKIHYYKYIFA